MNTTALVDRLNFAYQLTSGRFAGQKFDAPRVVALGLMSEPVVVAAPPPNERARGGKADWMPATLKKPSPAPQQPPAASGTELALRVLEETLVGGAVSPKTSELVHKQLADAKEKGTPPADLLNVLTALVLGSPEFQMR